MSWRLRDPLSYRFLRNAMKDRPLRAPHTIGTDGANVHPAAIKDGVDDGWLTPSVFLTARRTIAAFEARLWPRRGLGFAGEWTVRRQNERLALC